MIKIENLTKIYKSKKGKLETTALSNINLNLDNKGLIFIVGKSGSGKTTLLNLIGGIDTPDYGKIIVNNKNINEFKNIEYDEYRNTYIGFIFQEFNLLEKYNIYENIEISLKLQGQTVNKDKILNLLQDFGLKGYENRKVSELSGGQKQRVAIIRAICKNPQIILADEPTGNLDSITSMQIFEILKSISREKLVLVVSHDLLSAKKYADRIIEIKNGKINFDSNLNDIKEENNIIKLKKSKLPLRYAFKMAFESLKYKPFKLISTILLTTISFIFMSVMLTFLLFNEEKLINNTIKDNNEYIYSINKTSYNNTLDEDTHNILEINNDDINNIQKLTNSKLNIAYKLYDNSKNLTFELGESDYTSSFFIDGNNYTSVFIDVKDDRIIDNNIIGKKINNSNEIIIHKYLADLIIKYGIKLYNEEIYYPKSYNEIVNSNEYIKLGENKVKIVGIIDDNDSLFKDIKDNIKDFETQELKNYYYDTYYYNGILIYTKNFIDNINLDKEIFNVYIYEDNINTLNRNLSKLDYLYTKKCNNKNNVHYTYSLKNNELNSKINNFININNTIKLLILVLSFIFILFSFILFSNFIYLSITYNKKEIGILRSLGSRNKDIIKIFTIESIMIGLISFAISFISWIFICNVLNSHLYNSLYYVFNPIVLNPLVQIIMFIYSISISLLVTSALISKISKINILDVILNK